MPEYILGLDAKAYFSTTALTSADFATATETELTNVKDVTVNLEKGEADVTTRANDGWRATAGTLKEMTVEFEMQWKDGDAGFTAVKNAYLNNTEIAFAALTGDIDTGGSQGPAGNFNVTNFSRSEPLEEAITVSVTLKASSYQHWFTAAS